MFSYDVNAEVEADSDLEWILSSGQASSEMACEALLAAFYAPVYRLMFAWRLDPLAAQRSAETVFVQALARLDRMSATPDLEQWIYTLALNVARQSAPTAPGRPASAGRADDDALILALQKLKPQDRWELLAYYGLEWTAAEVAARIAGPQSQIETRLRENARVFENLLPPEDQAAAFKSAFEHLWPAPDLSDDGRQHLARDVHVRAQQQRAGLRRAGRIKEWITIVLAVIMAGALFWVVEAALPVADPPPGETAGALSSADSDDSRRSAPRAALAAETTATPTPAAESSPRRRIGPRFWTLRPGGVYFVQPGETIEGLAARLGMRPDRLRTANNLSAADRIQPGQVLYMPERPATGDGSAARLNLPLSLDSTPQEIYRRILQGASAWQTLWLDANIELDGPQGLTGETRRYRVQVWRDRPNARLLVVSGSVDGTVQEVFLVRGGYAYLAQPSADGSFRFRKLDEGEAIQSVYLANLALYPVGDLEQADTSFAAVEEVSLLRRDALVVEQQNGAQELLARFWLDRFTGLPLRQQVFSARAPERGLLTVTVEALAYDQKFSEDIFEPTIAQLEPFFEDGLVPASIASEPFALPDGAADSPADTQTAAAPMPPDSALFFEVARLYKTRTAFTPPFADHTAEIFAGDRSLGQIPFGDPWRLTCDRSPDGRRLAFVDVLSTSEGRKAPLFWLDLTETARVHTPFNYLFVTEFVFGPDSRRLAVVGYIPPAAGSIYILDVESGRYTRFLNVRTARSLVWSPDGQYIAFLGRLDETAVREQLIVLQADTGEIELSVDWDPVSGPDSDSALAQAAATWGEAFPAQMHGLANCAAPVGE